MNNITFTTNANIQEFEMWDNVFDFLKIALEQGYICVIKAEEPDIIVCDYEHDESIHHFGCEYPVWLTPEEHEELLNDRYDKQIIQKEEVHPVVKIEDNCYSAINCPECGFDLRWNGHPKYCSNCGAKLNWDGID